MADQRRPAPQPSEAMRSCIKPGCRWPAVATLSYRYATAEVWLADLGESHPATHDLCPHHADDMRVPRGWTLVDDRRPVDAVREPSAAELVERNTRLRSNVDAMLERPSAPRASASRSRYADLLANLPTYDPAEDPDAADAEAQGPAPHEPPAPAPTLVSVGIAHELAPVVRERRVGWGDRPDPDAVHETGIRGAIVVQLPLRMDEPAGGSAAHSEDTRSRPHPQAGPSRTTRQDDDEI